MGYVHAIAHVGVRARALSLYIYNLALTSRRAAQVGPVGPVHSLRSFFPKPHPLSSSWPHPRLLLLPLPSVILLSGI